MQIRNLLRLSGIEWALFSLFVGFVVVGLSFHEFWTDELRPWSMMNGTSFVGFFEVLKDELHPPGWYLIIKSLQWLRLPPDSMKWISGVFTIGSFFLLLRFSPFTKLQKCLLCFNLYFLYQYGAFGRPYSLEVFFLYSVCSLYSVRNEFRKLMFSSLLLLSLTHAFGTIYASILISLYLVSEIKSRRGLSWNRILLFLGVLVLLVVQFLSWSFHGVLSYEQLSIQRLVEGFSFISQSLLPLAPFEDNWWQRSLWSDLGILKIIPPVFFLAFLWQILKRSIKDPIPAVFYVTSASIILLIFVFFKFSGFNLNHIGQIFLLALGALWMLRANGGVLFSLSCFVCALTGLWMYVSDIQRPYSMGIETASYMRELKDIEVVVDIPYFSNAWTAYDGFEVISIEGERVSFFKGDKKILTDMVMNTTGVLSDFQGHLPRSSDQYLNRLIAGAYCSTRKDIILVTNYPFSDGGKELCLKEEKRFVGAIVPLENFYIYRWNKCHVNSEICP